MARRRLRVSKKAYKRKAYKRKGFTVVRAGKRIKMPPTNVKAARVPATTFYIKDIGAKGRGKKVIKKIRKGLLRKFGYSIDKSASQRRTALRKADKAYGSVSLFRKLQAQVVMRKRIQPVARKVFVADRNWVKKNLLSKAERLAMTRKPRRKWKRMTPAARAAAMPSRKKRR